MARPLTRKTRPILELPPRAAPDPASKPPVMFLDAVQAADFLRLSPRTLEKQRVVGGGPRFMKLGRRVVYKLADLEAWASARVCCSTADAASHCGR